MSNTKFTGKVCIITGGASGLGKEMGRQLAVAGAIVVLADINNIDLDHTDAEIAQGGGQVKSIKVDVTDAESVRQLIEGTASAFGRIDYLFNNAGTAVLGEIRDLDLEQWRRVLEVNLFGEIHAIHYAYPIMIRQGFGHIVNMASGFGMAPGPLNSPYVASKFAVFGISHALAAEARDFGIHVSIVCPGYIDTGMIGGLKPVNADGAALRAQIPVPLVPVDRAARIILAKVTKRRLVIVFPGYVRVLTFLHRFLPPLFARFSLHQVRQFRKIRTP